MGTTRRKSRGSGSLKATIDGPPAWSPEEFNPAGFFGCLLDGVLVGFEGDVNDVQKVLWVHFSDPVGAEAPDDLADVIGARPETFSDVVRFDQECRCRDLLPRLVSYANRL